MYINKELKVIRELLSFTQQEIASHIGASLESVHGWENEKVEID